jgi:uncharacterized protein (DUF488 family)
MATIFSIGHSNRSIGEFIAILHSFGIDTLADIRSLPASKYCPQFNKAEFAASLQQAGISYIHMPQLGGKREGGFRPYMESPEFEIAVNQLEIAAICKRLAYMCAEADWMHCHRSLISGYLYKRDWEVMHIKALSLSETHTTCMKQGKLF